MGGDLLAVAAQSRVPALQMRRGGAPSLVAGDTLFAGVPQNVHLRRKIPCRIRTRKRLQAHGVYIEIVRQAGHAMAWENPQGLAEAISKGLAR